MKSDYVVVSAIDLPLKTCSEINGEIFRIMEVEHNFKYFGDNGEGKGGFVVEIFDDDNLIGELEKLVGSSSLDFSNDFDLAVRNLRLKGYNPLILR